MENKESLLEEIEEFNKQGDESKPLSSSLESFIEHVAKSGTHVFPWQTIRKIYIRKLKSVLAQLPAAPPVPPVTADESNISTNSNLFAARLPQISYALSQKPVPTVTDLGPTIQIMKDRILERMESFYNAPFTIQRISELLVKPQIHYKRADKFLRGLEKCIMVVTTVDSEGKKIFIDNTITNGIADEQLPLPVLLPPPPVPPLLSDRTMTPPLLPPPIPSQNQQPPTSQTNSSVFSSFEYFTTVSYQSKSDSKEESVTEVTTTTSSAVLTRSLSVDMQEESTETTRVSLKREQVLSAEEQAQEVIKRPRTKSNNDETPLQADQKDEEVIKANGEEEIRNDSSIDQPMENDENVQAVADSSGQQQQQTPQDQEATN